MNVEHIVNLQSSMQYLPTKLPIIILQRVEEQLLPVIEVGVGAVCREKNYSILFWGFLWPKRIKCFLGILRYV
jgi:hypothetical protein